MDSTPYNSPPDTINSDPSSIATRDSQNTCWICGSPKSTPWKERSLTRKLVPEDFQITDKRYGMTLGLLKCSDCGFIYTDRHDMEDLVALYEQLSDDAYLESSDSRLRQMKWLFDLAVRACPHAKTILDIGAGIGLLVNEAKERGFDAVGVEPSRQLVEIGRSKFNVDLKQGIFPHPDLVNRKFDLIFFVDVVEHVNNPVELLNEISKSLSPNGKLILVTPDVESYAAKILGRRWWHYRLAHVGYFCKRTISMAAEKGQLRVERFHRAKWFFPVSYLAERLSQYLPLQWFNKIALKTPGLRWIYQRVVTVNLFDSWVAVISHKN